MSRIKHSASFAIPQAIEVLFPLFSAEGEKAWVPGWDYINLMGSNELHEDYVFLTTNHDHASADAIWIVKEYDPTNYRVKFYKVEPEQKLGIIEVKCISEGDYKTRVQVTYEYIGLSENGNKFVAGFTTDDYQVFITEWENLLLKYFEDIANK